MFPGTTQAGWSCSQKNSKEALVIAECSGQARGWRAGDLEIPGKHTEIVFKKSQIQVLAK